MKKRRSIEKWRGIIREQAASGLTAKDYCAKRCINQKVFYRKRAKLSRATGGFIEIEPPRCGGVAAVVVVEAGGMRVEVHEISVLGAVVATLRGRSC